MRRKKTNREFAVDFLKKRGEVTHKQIVKALLKRNGLDYDENTRKYYDPLLYGTKGPATGVLDEHCYPSYNDKNESTWLFVS